jgi:sulfite reductase alpha subunit-like flavoprotein
MFSLSNMAINCRPTNLGTHATDNSFVKKLKSSGRSLVVFYGSQTGTGEEFAGRLAKEGIRYHLKGMVADPEECDMVCRVIYFSSLVRNGLLPYRKKQLIIESGYVKRLKFTFTLVVLSEVEYFHLHAM